MSVVKEKANKYVKLKSLTWWSGFVPLTAGVFVALEPVHHLANYAEAVSTMYGGVSPAIPINAGLAIIGFRGSNG